ncbi:hypothetical protein RCL_jg12140.t1 [Rhizophagus clarus]|uniref:Uncharacterized protein n=1 Tax=Rhizophagus clarus TaxID=94130 RepID=A0A8H3KYI7_9GLOM|nr:hypothetical protein RCL_jg12140.t1 [Rhizophagus clarus]
MMSNGFEEVHDDQDDLLSNLSKRSSKYFPGGTYTCHSLFSRVHHHFKKSIGLREQLASLQALFNNKSTDYFDVVIHQNGSQISGLQISSMSLSKASKNI